MEKTLPHFHPWEMKEKCGFDVDVAKLIAKDLGVELELIPVTSKQRIPYLETDKADLVIASKGATGRAKSIWFSSAYAPFFSEPLQLRV